MAHQHEEYNSDGSDQEQEGAAALLPADGEESIECPYAIDGHQALKHRMLGHLVKCRRNYETVCEAEEVTPILVQCRYNPEDLVYAPEIVLHESLCSDRNRISTHTITQQIKLTKGDETEDDQPSIPLTPYDLMPHDVTYVTRGIMEYSTLPSAEELEELEEYKAELAKEEKTKQLELPQGLLFEQLEEFYKTREVDDDSDDSDDDFENPGLYGEGSVFLWDNATSKVVLERTENTVLVYMRKNRKTVLDILPDPPAAKSSQAGAAGAAAVPEIEDLKPPKFDEDVPWTRAEDWDQQMFALQLQDDDKYDPQKAFLADKTKLTNYPPYFNMNKAMRKEYLDRKKTQINSTKEDGEYRKE